MKFYLGKLVHYLIRKARLVKQPPGPVPEFDLEAPMVVPKACVVRALMDRMVPGQQIILRSSDLEMPWEMEHLCNRLGHELLEVEREGATYFFTLRVRGDENRLPTQDPFHLDLSPQKPILTIDVTPVRKPWRLFGRSGILPASRPALKTTNE